MPADDAFDANWDWLVLVNDEGEHALWPAVNEIPAGWQAVGTSGPKPVCIAYVEAHWTHMRPRSLRA